MSKKNKLLSYLQNFPGWHTSQELAIQLELSKRTIKNYVQQFRDQGILISSSVKGYHLEQSSLDKKQDNTKFKVHKLPDNNEERVNYIINVLVNSSSSINVYDLANNLFVSESTILQNLKQAEREVKRFGIKLIRKGDFWSLDGNERQKRSLLSSLIYEETSGVFMNRNIIQENFPQINIHQLEKSILKIFHKQNIYLNTFELNNLILHFAIAIDRCSNGHRIKDNNFSSSVKKQGFGMDLVNSIVGDLQLVLTNADCQELALVIETDLGNEKTTKNIVSEETQKLVTDLISYVWQNYEINLDTFSFKKRFALHLDRLIMRSRTQNIEHNPLATNIKYSSPTIYECAVIMANRITEKAKITITDSEIGYIAMHIGNAMAEQITDKQKISVVIIIPEYYDNSLVLLKRLQKKFSAEIDIKKIIHDPANIRSTPNAIDLLISVGSNYIDSKISTVNISQFLLSNDIQTLQVAITSRRRQIKRDHFQEELLKFFSSDNFIKSKKVTNIDQVFEIVNEKFFEQGVVEKDFKKLLKQRENLSSTAFDKVAIPHSLNMTARKSRGFVVINPKGIEWSDNNKVYLVIALAIDPNNKQLFRSVFDELSDIITNIDNVIKLINSQNYGEFIINLVEML